jgi:hypothetical protein
VTPHIRIPTDALNLGVDFVDETIIYGIYRMADEARYNSFKAPSRMLRARFNGVSSRRVEDILKALVSSGFIELVEPGAPRKPRVIRILRCSELVEEGEPHVPSPKAGSATGSAEGSVPVVSPDVVQVQVSGVPGAFLMNKTGSAEGSVIRARFLTESRSQNTDMNDEDSNEDEQQDSGQPSAAPSAHVLSKRTLEKLRAAGIRGRNALAAMTATEVGNRQGIGKKTVLELAAYLGAHGLSFRAEAPRKPRVFGPQNQQERDTGAAWSAAWVKVTGAEKYIWNFPHDHPRIVKLVDFGSPEQVQEVAEAYLRDHAAGRAFPKDGGANLTTFTTVLSQYQGLIVNGHTGPQGGAQAKDPAEAAWATILGLIRHGHLGKAILAGALGETTEEHARRLAAVNAAGGNATLNSIKSGFETDRAKKAFIDHYRRAT